MQKRKEWYNGMQGSGWLTEYGQILKKDAVVVFNPKANLLSLLYFST